MNLSFFIARRYLFSKKSHNIINIISGISTFTVAVVTAAMVIVISAFDGLEHTITNIYKSFDADIVITPAKGKVFIPNAAFLKKLDDSGMIEHRSNALEENVLLRFDENQAIATIKGVDANYNKVSGLDTLIVEGDYDLGTDTIASAMLGYGVAYKLDARINNFFSALQVYAAKRKMSNSVTGAEDFTPRTINISGVFSVQQQPEYDDKYVVTPLWFAQEILGRDSSISSIEIKLKPGIGVENARDDFQELLGDDFVVKNRYQLHEVLYKVINSEKWALFLILSLIMLVAIFNIMGSLTMLIVEKYEDSQTLKALGLDNTKLQGIFRTEGVLIALLGSLAGIIVGLGLCLAQKQWSFLLMAGDGSLPYPIEIIPIDIAYIFLIVMGVAAGVSWLTARRSVV